MSIAVYDSVSGLQTVEKSLSERQVTVTPEMNVRLIEVVPKAIYLPSEVEIHGVNMPEDGACEIVLEYEVVQLQTTYIDATLVKCMVSGPRVEALVDAQSPNDLHVDLAVKGEKILTENKIAMRIRQMFGIATE